MILFNTGTATRALVDNYFRRIGIQPRIVMESESVASIKPLVRVNLGVSILPLPAVAAEAKRGELIYLRLADYPFTRDIGLVFHKSVYRPKPLVELIRLFEKSRKS
jgi:DNA-binding transcriptional LysR family regulator